MTINTKNLHHLSPLALKFLIIIGTQKGGAGKTTTADAVASTFRFGGLTTLVVDVDAGNSGYIRRCGADSAICLPWETGADHIDQWCDRHLPTVEAVVVDLGANFLAADPPASEFLSALLDKAEAASAVVKTFVVASPNAPGTGRLVRSILAMFGASTIVIKNNTDGSGNFAKSLSTRQIPTADLGHVSPGIMAARLSHEVPLSALIGAPPAGHRLATAILARQLLHFARQPALAEIVPEAAISALERHAADAPHKLQMHVSRAQLATDDALSINMKLADESRRLRGDALPDPNHPAHAYFLLMLQFENLP